MINGLSPRLIVSERKETKGSDFEPHDSFLRNTNPASYRILFGLHDRLNQESWVVSRNVQRIVVHPSYVSQNFVNDIALMQLSVMRANSTDIQTFS